ncbi:inhibitor of growth protein 1-like isoform X1 [Lingula anatina]|uniref:Inhibitor of growth protein n=1 Tax=Lingula anatina TaxID=7574 RepID=A0A2R2MLM2_LINAN|nr:inhibitor of growth protein 1-like isoform X1 [Lingula anatina]|eukprot:XP_023931123.1 inhibitor of growth protein 1-like isoform X1 [Lingula anatina]
MSLLNQAAVEALCSATYLDNYLDCLDSLPDDLQRVISQMRELDAQTIDIMNDLEHHHENYQNENDVNSVKRSIIQVQRCLIKTTEIGDEKLHLVSQIIEFIENRTRQLEQDLENLDSLPGHTDHRNTTKTDYKSTAKNSNRDSVLSPVQAPSAGKTDNTKTSSKSSVGKDPSSHMILDHRDDTQMSNKSNSSTSVKKEKKEISSATSIAATVAAVAAGTTTPITSDVEPKMEKVMQKRQRRQKRERTESVSKEEEKKEEKEKVKKKKKRKVKKEKEDQRIENPIDPEEPTFCLCDQISYGEMIACDNEQCEIEWFHFNCVQLSTKPKGKWFCPNCRGDKSNVKRADLK